MILMSTLLVQLSSKEIRGMIDQLFLERYQSFKIYKHRISKRDTKVFVKLNFNDGSSKSILKTPQHGADYGYK